MNQWKNPFSFFVSLLSDFQRFFMPAFERKFASKQGRDTWTLSKILLPLMMTANEGNMCDVLKWQSLECIKNCAQGETKRLPKNYKQTSFQVFCLPQSHCSSNTYGLVIR